MFEPFRQLLRDLKHAGHQTVGIFIFPAILGKYKGFRIYLYYLKTFGLSVFVKLVIMVLGEIIRRFFRSFWNKEPYNYRALGKEFGVPIIYEKNPNSSGVVGWVQENNVDVIFISFGHIIKNPLIHAAKIAVVNKHSALLPAYRGLFPVFWTLLEGKISVGSTVHKVVSAIDAGEILFQRSYDHLENKTVFCYYKQIYSDLPSSLLRSLEILEGKRQKEMIVNTLPSYFGLPSRADYKRLLNKGYKFI